MRKIKEKVQVGDIGTAFAVTLVKDKIPVDISAALTKQLTILRNDGTEITNDAIFSTNGSDGTLVYITVSGDLTIPGEYAIQAYVILPDWEGMSSIGKFTVLDNI